MAETSATTRLAAPSAAKSAGLFSILRARSLRQHPLPARHNIRSGTVLGIVGAGGIGYDLTVSAGLTKTHPVVSAIIGIIIVMVLVVEALAGCLRHVFRWLLPVGMG